MIRCRAVKKDGKIVMGELRDIAIDADELIVRVKPIVDFPINTEIVKLSECRKIVLSDVKYSNSGD